MTRKVSRMAGRAPVGMSAKMIFVITGPDDHGDFAILGAGGNWSYPPRFVAEDLVAELQRRLDLPGALT